jgi:hypothetical protein
MLTRALLLVGIILVAVASAVAGTPNSFGDRQRLVETAISADPATAERAIAELRDRGPSSLRSLLVMRVRIVSARAADSKTNSAESAANFERIERTLRKLETVIDRVAGQRYAYISRLYWYTDLEKAKAVAAQSGKPILSLRMLGNLTDEFSCANSRFFRTTLYANRKIADQLGSRFVLHWKSVRPVPRVTIDFGDGRKLERTLTGNSAHYALAADGTPLDVLPGLYGPRQFLAWLTDVERLHRDVQSIEPANREARLRAYHAERSAELTRRWQTDLAAVDDDAGNPKRPGRAIPDELWHKIALLERHRVELDEASRRVIRRENPGAARAGALSVTKAVVEDPILRLVRTLQATIALDSVRNEYTLHRQAHEWFAAGNAPDDVERLNDRVYAELFLTPASDPWLGLAPADAYTALTDGGVVTASP